MTTSGEAEVDRLVDGLYAEPLAEFVAARARLAGDLKKAGKRAEAAAVAKAGKPTVSAWVSNQIARRERALVQRLAEASAGVRAAQLAMVKGKGDREAFTSASAAQRAALADVREAAERLLANGGHAVTPAVLERISRNFRAMVASEDLARQVEAGRLVEDLAVESLDGLAALSGALPSGGSHRPAAPARASAPEAAPPGRAAATADAGAERAAARKRQLEQAAHEREVAGLRRAADAAELHWRKLDTAAGRAESSARTAAATAAGARAAAESARREMDEARRRLEDAKA